MVENGRRLGLTGAFQSVQWAAHLHLLASSSASVGGWLAERRSLRAAFAAGRLLPAALAGRGGRRACASPAPGPTARPCRRACAPSGPPCARARSGRGRLHLPLHCSVRRSGPASSTTRRIGWASASSSSATSPPCSRSARVAGALSYAPMTRRLAAAAPDQREHRVERRRDARLSALPRAGVGGDHRLRLRRGST